MTDGTTRQIKAILAADMVGFSGLLERDETGTLARQKALLRTVIEPEIANHGGRIVKLTGDGLLATFDSVVAAVGCAVALQRGLTAGQAAGDPPLRYRMAVHIGDIVQDAGDIYGDGVNVAARLEALASPGGIVVSGTAHDMLKNHLDVTYQFLGERRLKNIETPVRVFAVDFGQATPRAAARGPRRAVIVAFAAVLLSAFLAAGWLWQGQVGHLDPGIASAVEDPSIIVLPLENLSGDPGEDYFANGLTEDITTGLSALPDLFVVSRNTAFSLEGTDPDPRALSEAIGVRYILSGSVRRVDDTLRIIVTLVDGRSGQQLWAERYDGSPEDVLGFNDDVTARVVDALPLQLTTNEIATSETGATRNALAFDAFLRASDLYRLRTAEGHVAAVGHLERAIALDPGYGRAYALLAAVYFEAWDNAWTEAFGLPPDGRHRLKATSLDYVKEAMRAPTALAHLVAARHHRVDGETDKMLAEARAALRLDPNDPDAFFTLALALLLAGSHEGALGAITHAMKIDPAHPPDYLMLRGAALFMLGRFEEADRFLARARERDPNSRAALMFRVATLQKLGRPVQEEIEALRMRGEQRQGTRLRWRFADEEDWRRIEEALVAAGLTLDD